MNGIHRKNKINILLCMGTRPEGIKLAPVVGLLKKQSGTFKFKICSTGQHKEMLDQVFNFFEINPDYDLNLMTEDQSLGYLSSRILNKMNEVLDSANPDLILIQGDTTTAFLTALSGFYRGVKVGHVEAGLRTYDKYNPFPEEINRQLISRVADLHFAPTKRASDNLLNENIGKENIIVTGNTIVDAILWGIKKILNSKKTLEDKRLLKGLDRDRKIILVTMHRRESFGREIENVCKALRIISARYNRIQIVYPVHLNPNVRKPVFKLLGKADNIKLIDPLDYESFLWLMSRSYFIVTDSGSVQEEAPTLKKPVLVIRKKTERMESLGMGISRLIGTETKNIIDNVSELLDSENSYRKMISNKNPYGDGHAAEKILNFISKRLG